MVDSRLEFRFSPGGAEAHFLSTIAARSLTHTAGFRIIILGRIQQIVCLLGRRMTHADYKSPRCPELTRLPLRQRAKAGAFPVDR